MTSKPRFERRGQLLVDLVISDTNQSFEISWGSALPRMQFIPVSLDTNRVYSFTVGQKAFQNSTIPELRKVQSGGHTIYDIEICEIHKAKMEHKEVKITSDPRRRPDEPSIEVERRLFPHSREYSVRRCVISVGGFEPDSPKTERVYVCSDCRKAYEKWKAENKKIK